MYYLRRILLIDFLMNDFAYHNLSHLKDANTNCNTNDDTGNQTDENTAEGTYGRSDYVCIENIIHHQFFKFTKLNVCKF